MQNYKEYLIYANLFDLHKSEWHNMNEKLASVASGILLSIGHLA